MIACRALNEPYHRILTYPWDEILSCVFEAQQLERDEGLGAIVQLLQQMR